MLMSIQRCTRERMNNWHDWQIHYESSQEGDLVLLFNSSSNLFPGKWSSPFKMMKVHPY